MKKIDESSIILRFSDDDKVIHDVGLDSILEGGFPIDTESGNDMEYLGVYLIPDNSLARTPDAADLFENGPENKDLWDEDEYWLRSDWRYDVSNGDTNLGYWEWVEHNKDCATSEDAEDSDETEVKP